LARRRCPGSDAGINQHSPNLTVQDLRPPSLICKRTRRRSANDIRVGFGGADAELHAGNVGPDLYRAVVYSGPRQRKFENVHAPVLGNYAQYDFALLATRYGPKKTMHDAERNLPITCIPALIMTSTAQVRKYNADAAKLCLAELWISLKK